MIKAVFPGTFDPVTNGHMDIIERASGIVDALVILVVINSAKKSMFTFEERVSHLEHLTRHIGNVSVSSWDGLTASFAQREGAGFIIRGLRSGTDFDYESQIAEANKNAVPGTETVFIKASPELSYLSSSVVKEFFSYGGRVDKMVDAYILDKLNEKKRK